MHPGSLKHCLLAALAIAGVIGGSVNAAPVPVPDFSFENTEIADGVNTGAPNVGTNWLASGNAGVFLGNPMDDRFAGTTGSPGLLPAPADGTNALFMNMALPGYAWQNVAALQSNTTYTLTVSVGLGLISPGGVGKIALVNGTGPFDTVLGSTAIDTTAATAGTFADSTLTFTTGQKASGRLTILLQGDSGGQFVFDNVRLDATPAPQNPTTFVPTASPTNTVYQGTPVTLTQDAAGALPLHHQWQTDGGSGGATFTNIPGANGTTYVADTSGFGVAAVQYRVVVTNSFGGSTSGPVALTAISGQPVLLADTLPASGSDMVGGRVTFTAALDGTRPISYQWQVDTGGGPVDIPGATNTTLTLTNLQLVDTGTYSLQASNVLGVISTTGRPFTVNPAPDPVDNILTFIATQLGAGGSSRFTPTWGVATNSLISGTAPSSVGTGVFNRDSSGVVAVLTDGKFGTLFPAGNGSADLITGGPTGGQSVTYTLPASATGYDLTNIVVYGGWSDAGRDQQRYVVYYSTVASPTTFNQLVGVNFNPSNPTAAQSAVRSTLVSATTAPLVKNVAAVRIDFAVLDQGVENGYAGYSEISLFGVPSAPAPVVATNTLPVTGSDVVGSTVTFVAAFGSSTPVTYQWRKDTGSGPVIIPGATNSTLTLTNLQLSDTAAPGYSLLASNASGVAVSSASSFTVNPVPDPDGSGVIISPANQTATGARFTPTWTIATSSLIAGTAPSSFGTGNFSNEGGGGRPVLTDGVFGAVGSGNNSTLATAGSGAGQSVTYTLTGSASGYDLTNIVTYGGWSDGGRDQQHYTVSYSTVNDPANFIPLAAVDYNPTLPGSVRTTDRVTITSAMGTLATNVSRVRFDFTVPSGENGWSGYAEIGVFGRPSAALSFAPVVTADTLPVTGSDVVGSQVTFKATFDGTAPISYQWQVDTGGGPVDIVGATSPTLTLNNLQLSDTASYSLRASNVLGVASSTPSPLTVNPTPAAVNSIVTAVATQTGTSSGTFTPTWSVAGGSLIAGTTPSSVGSGNFSADASGTVAVLTDGTYGFLNPPGNGSVTFVTAGTGAGGQSVTYTLTGSAGGYDLTNIVVYGGWSDGGRDQQHYTVSYSTVANPTTFTTLASVNYQPTLPGTVQSAVRVTLLPETSAPLATNVARVRFDFTTPTGENGYSGYSEISLFGRSLAGPAQLTINPLKVSGGNLILTGTGGTPGGNYVWLTSTNVAASLATWTTNSTGVFDGSSGFSNALPITPSEPARFFKLRTP